MPPTNYSHASFRKDFIKLLEKAASRYMVIDVFSDACGAMACALEQLSHASKEREERYAQIMSKYNADEQQLFSQMLTIVIDALEHHRESFLGPVLEEIGAANCRNGQFLTPSTVGRLMGRITAVPAAAKHTPGELITLNDPACGAGVLMIDAAEELLQENVPQRDIFIVAGDIDYRACDIAFIELSLLGYAARIDHMDALSMQYISRPRWTVGYFLHGTQYREHRATTE